MFPYSSRSGSVSLDPCRGGRRGMGLDPLSQRIGSSGLSFPLEQEERCELPFWS